MRRLCPTLAAIALLAVSNLYAGPDRGTIQGTVRDPQGAVMPGVDVTVRNVDTQIESRLKTNSVGFYLVTELVPGSYKVTFNAPAFNALEISGVKVTAGGVAFADASMRVGDTTQNVQVTAEIPLVEATASNFTTAVESRMIQNMPINGRDIQTLVQLIPGVIQSAGPSGANFGFNSQFGGFPDPLHLVGSSISVNGSQAGANGWYLEGSLNATVGAESTIVNPSPDAVAEFNIVANGLAAEYGRTSGAVVNVVLKSGTNQLHGNLYNSNRNSFFSATNPFSRRDASGTPMLQPRINWNNPGGTLGGPVYIPKIYDGKNRTFFFVSEDVSLLHENVNRILTVPLPAERNGDFRGDPRFAANCGSSMPGITNCLYDPFTTTGPDENGFYHRTPFPTPLIPQNRMDPLARFYVNSFPNPNYLDPIQQGPDGCGGLCNNYLGAVGSSMTTHNVSIKIDHTVNDKHRLFVTWLYNPSYYSNFRYPWNGPTAQTNTGIAGAQPYRTRNQLAQVGWTANFTPTTINELRFSFGRQSLVSQPNLESVTQNQEVYQRVKNLNFLLYKPFQPVPTISFSNPVCCDYTSFGPVQYQNGTMGQQAFTLTESLTKVFGRHTVKAGMMFQRNNLWTITGSGYNIGFDSSLTGDPFTYQGGDGLASFLLGAVGQGAASTGVQYAPWQTNDTWGFYAQDDFRVSSSLTLNFGLRWDVFGWIRERHNMLANYDLGAMNPEVPYKGKMVYMGTPGHPGRNLFPANKNSFGPRFGFAWAPGGSKKTVIRGGYGLIYSNSLSALFGQGNGAVSSPGSSQVASIPITDYSYTTPAFILSQGAPTIPLPDLTENRRTNAQLVGVSSPIMGFMQADHDPYVQRWSLFVQHEFPGNMVLSTGYVGSHGLHLLGEEIRNLNYIPTATQQKIRGNINNNIYPVASQLSGIWDCGPNGNQTTCSGWYALAPYPQWWSVQNLLSPDGYNRYNSLQVRFEKRYSHGLNFITSYTYSKNMVSQGLGALVANTIGPTTISNKGVGRIAFIPGAAGGGVADGSRHVWYGDPDNRKAYDALAPDDITHVLNVAATYELPVGKGRRFLSRPGLTDLIFGGWKLSQNWNFQTGVPMSFTSVARNYLWGGWGTGTPDAIGDLSAGRSAKTKAQRADQWYNPNALAAPFGPDPAILHEFTTGTDLNGNPVDPNTVDAFWKFGNAGIRPPSGRIPGFWNTDMSLAKDFHLTEARYFNFRWDVFNALNHQNLGVPNNMWCLPPYPDGSTDAVHQVGCQFGKITNTQTDPRAMQFSLKFYW